MIIAVDFDGTLHNAEFPSIGNPLPASIEVMQKLKQDGHTIILWTCRSGQPLYEAVVWMVENEIPFDYINRPCPEHMKKFDKDSRKVYADTYIDDKGLTDTINWNEIYEIINRRNAKPKHRVPPELLNELEHYEIP